MCLRGTFFSLAEHVSATTVKQYFLSACRHPGLTEIVLNQIFLNVLHG